LSLPSTAASTTLTLV